MSFKVTWIARLAAAAVALAAVSARAQTDNTNFELERLQFNPSGSGGLTIWDGALMTPGSFRVSAAGQYEYAPLVLHRPDGFPFGILVKERATIHLSVAYSVIEWVEVAAQVPGVFFSNGSAVAGLTVPRGKHLGTPWLSARFPIIRPGMLNLPFSMRLGGELGVGFPFAPKELYANANGVMFQPRLSAGFSAGQIEGALELSALVRPEASLESFSGSTFDRALNTWAVAAMMHTGGTGARVEVNARYARNFFAPGWGAEILGGLRLPFSARGPELFVEAGPGVGSLIGQPTFRVYAGLAFGGSQKQLAGPTAATTSVPAASTESPTLPLPPPKAVPEAGEPAVPPAAPAPDAPATPPSESPPAPVPPEAAPAPGP